MAIDFLEMNAKAIEEFRANDGECGPPFEGTPIVLVTMILLIPESVNYMGEDMKIRSHYSLDKQ